MREPKKQQTLTSGTGRPRGDDGAEAAADHQALGPDGEVPPRLIYTVGRFDRVLRIELRRRLRNLDLTIAEFTTLTVLRRRKGLSNAQLARRAMVSAQAMNQVLAALEQKGLVSRSAAPRGDTLDHHRARIVGLTAAGETCAELCDEIVASVEDVALRSLDEDARRDLASALRTATDDLRHIGAVPN